jgi:hypothetical protein
MAYTWRAKRVGQGVNDSLSANYQVDLPAKILPVKSKRSRGMKNNSSKIVKQKELPRVLERDREHVEIDDMDDFCKKLVNSKKIPTTSQEIETRAGTTCTPPANPEELRNDDLSSNDSISTGYLFL